MTGPSARVAIEIRAPIEVVWATILATDAYGEWNPFVVRIEQPRATLAVGDRIRLHVRWADGRGTASSEEVLRVSPPEGTPRRASLEWAFRGPMHTLGLVRAHRVQSLEELAPGVTAYRSEETFRGLLTAFLPLAAVQDGFDRHAQALRIRAEAVASTGPARVTKA